MSLRGRFSNLFVQIWHHLGKGIDRLQNRGWPLIQTALAASLAWYLATLLFGHPQPFFGPIAAVLSLGVLVGHRGRRAIEIVLGVALGLVVADAFMLAIGTGTVQLGIVVAAAMAAVVIVGGDNLLVNQAAISAILVAILQPPTSTGLSPDRFLDALTGCAVALLINYLFPINPKSRAVKAGDQIFDELVTALEQAARALTNCDPELAEDALQKGREISDRMSDFKETLEAGHETARFAPPRWGSLEHIELYTDAVELVDLVVLDVRGVARAAISVLRDSSSAGLESTSEAILDLSRAVEALSTHLKECGQPADARQFALKAAEDAHELLKGHNDLVTNTLIGQVRFTVIDLLRASGMDLDAALRMLEETIRRAPDSE